MATSRSIPAIIAIVLTLLLGHATALEIHFVDVGQGDGVLLVLPDGRGVVYDAGKNDGVMLRYIETAGITHLALAIASHAHADHIGGLPAVLDAYAPPFVLDNGVIHTTLTFERYVDAVLRSGAQLLEPTARTLTLGDVVLHVLPSPRRPGWGHNDNSVGIIVEYGAFRASLTGDAEPRLFAWWLETAPERLDAVHVHKASHHGSARGDTHEALARLRPQVVVVSAGLDNAYGHPDPAAIDAYLHVGAAVFRTDHHGSVVIRAARDGTYTVTTEHDRPPALAVHSHVVAVSARIDTSIEDDYSLPARSPPPATGWCLLRSACERSRVNFNTRPSGMMRPTMTTIFWMFLAGALAGILAAGMARSTAGRQAHVRVVLAVIAAVVVVFAAWLAFMVFDVGAAMRSM